jgi:peptidoglycan/LPS O-acetylase OafA/YrhL
LTLLAKDATSRKDAEFAEAVKPIYIPALDGLRAIAFFIVFVAHSMPSGPLPGGFGVTVFFFLSGYLILPPCCAAKPNISNPST